MYSTLSDKSEKPAGRLIIAMGDVLNLRPRQLAAASTVLELIKNSGINVKVVDPVRRVVGMHQRCYLVPLTPYHIHRM